MMNIHNRGCGGIQQFIPWLCNLLLIAVIVYLMIHFHNLSKYDEYEKEIRTMAESRIYYGYPDICPDKKTLSDLKSAYISKIDDIDQKAFAVKEFSDIYIEECLGDDK